MGIIRRRKIDATIKKALGNQDELKLKVYGGFPIKDVSYYYVWYDIGSSWFEYPWWPIYITERIFNGHKWMGPELCIIREKKPAPMVLLFTRKMWTILQCYAMKKYMAHKFLWGKINCKSRQCDILGSIGCQKLFGYNIQIESNLWYTTDLNIIKKQVQPNVHSSSSLVVISFITRIHPVTLRELYAILRILRCCIVYKIPQASILLSICRIFRTIKFTRSIPVRVANKKEHSSNNWAPDPLEFHCW